jgi:hypothetical protein
MVDFQPNRGAIVMPGTAATARHTVALALQPGQVM